MLFLCPGMLNYLFSTLLFCDEMVLIAAGVLSGPKALHANTETYGFLESDMQLPESKPELVKGEEALSCSGVMGDRISRDSKFPDVGDEAYNLKAINSCKPGDGVDSYGFLRRNLVQVDPSYLKTLGHTHSSWIFGAIAEFIDNSRDAQATKWV